MDVVTITNTTLNNCQTSGKPDYQNEMILNRLIQKKVSLFFMQSSGYTSSSFELIKNILRPPYKLSCKIFTRFKYSLDLIKRKLSDKKFRRNNVLYAFYDLEVYSATFDIIPFLIFAEKIRISQGLESLHVIIVPGSNQGFAKELFEYYKSMTPDKEKISFAYLEWRVRNILVPCIWLIPSCTQLTICTSRTEAQIIENLFAENIFPDKYLVQFPIPSFKNIYQMEATPDNPTIPSLSATRTACDFVSEWININCNGKKVVTITLREASYEIDRNSNIQNWAKFIRTINHDIFSPVIVRDTEKAFQSIPKEMIGLIIFYEASWNLEIRAALYELSYLNLFVSCGPMTLSWFNNKCRFLIFKLITDSVSNATEKNLNFVGLTVGDQPSYFSNFQKLVWFDDTYDAIKREFDEMCIKIERE